MAAGRAAVALLLAGTLLSACSSDVYPLHQGPGAEQDSPAALGQPVDGVVLFLQIRPGDRLELLGAEPVGIGDGATVELFFSPPVISAGGIHTVGETLEPLVGAVATAPEATDGPGNNVGIVARVTATVPGRYVLRSIRLRYRLNGEPAQLWQGIDVIFAVCAGDPKPVDCGQEPAT